MTIREILKMGDPRLLQVAEPLPDALFGTVALATLIEDLRDTMKAAGGAGLAAPQIGVSWRVVLFGFERLARYPQAEPVPETVLINPEIEVLADEGHEEGWEGCLSVPGLRGVVERPMSVRYRGRDAQGAWLEREARGFHARVVQHECDHLDGVLYPMKVRDFRRFGFTEVLFPGT
ncbi:peptide deformylase [Inhella gelatinilytica]|uniref:Peptide deformylase n=1 Tax=Inhella gelatinilytica TaxID=2795030 RepID=A0A931NAI4_9BURK|nr:peptide deformylase [Inhella gelatinilytica]MBH9552513.1 peptide deformylase [Inhella gelatinilytica]